jgi:hypothetical protein
VLKDVKGFTRTVGGSGVAPSSVRVRVRGGVANQEFGAGGGCIVVGLGEGQTRPSGEMHGTQWGGAHWQHAGHWWSRGGWVRHRGYGQLAWEG